MALTFGQLLEQRAPILDARIRLMKQEAQNNWLRSLGKNDFSHSLSIETNLNRLVPDNIKEIFDPGEIFVVLYSVYLHDIGYLLTASHHQKNSYDEIISAFSKYKLNNEFEAKAIATVCYGHAPENEVPLKSIDRRYGVAGLSDTPLNLQFLAALFRLADEIDNAYTRVVGIPTQKESMRHRVRFVDIDPEHWMICFQTEPRDANEWEKLSAMRKYTQERLNDLLWVIEPNGLKYRRIELTPEDNPYENARENKSSAEVRRKLQSLFKLKGYLNLQEDIRIGALLADLYGELPIPDDEPLRTTIHCYKRLDENTFRRVAQSLAEADDLVDRGFLISEAPIPNTIAEHSKAIRRLKVQTIDDLLANLIDFEHYLDKVVQDYEQDDVSHYYVDLGCEKRDGIVPTRYPSVHTYVNEFLTKGDKNHILLLGEYGSGKTSFCKRYAHDLAIQYRTHRAGNRIPLLITLRDYARVLSIEQFITDLLVNQYKLRNANFDTFTAMNEAGVFLLIFDGFDEMAQKVDPTIVQRNFKELSRTVTGKSKVILTCRTEFFRSSSQVEEVLSAAYVSSEDRPKFEIIYLQDLQADNIMEVLRRRVGGDKAAAYFEKMQEIENLMELARRPVLLNMILESWANLIPRKRVRAADLYLVYTDSWLDRDIKTHRTLMTRDDKILFMEELAFQMYLTDRLSVHYTEMPERIRQFFKLRKAEETDYFAHDVMTCSFLSRDDEGNYKFAHKSFMEYFVALRLVKEMRTGVFDYFNKKSLSASVLNFIRELAA